ncbi:MAG: hypothetical protein FJX72_03055 [Armatimonadetes bacterium]|nr:hypothetical protein [Armatimonadota bacterium]
MCEDAAVGQHIAACVRAIFRDWDATTCAEFQREGFKYTEAGVSISFLLDDGTPLYCGDERARDPAMVARVLDIGVSSIVEGSDAEVPLEWLNLPQRCHPDGDDGIETPEAAVAAFNKLVKEINDAACELWHEANDDSEGESDDDSEGTP